MSHSLCSWFRPTSASRRAIRFLAGIVCTMLSVAALAQDIPDEFGPPVVRSKVNYLSPENFSPNDEFLAFREHAHDFLRDHSDHVMAPRALHDLILIQTALPKPDPNVANGLKARLLMEYPESLAAHFTIKSFKDQSEFRNLLTADFRKPDRDFSHTYCRQFLKACELGLNAFGPGFVADDSLQFYIRLALSEGKSFRLSQLNEAHLEKLKDLPRAGFKLCGKAELTPIDRIAGLHQLIQTATPLQQVQVQAIKDAEVFWMSRLTEKDRDQPKILTILIEKRLELRKFDEALEGLNRLPTPLSEPKFYFWRAWSLANQDQSAAAMQVLETLKQQFPNDPWSKHGLELAEILRDQGKAIVEQSAVIQELIADWTPEHLQQLRINAQYHLANRKSVDVVARADDNMLDVFLSQSGQPLVGYKATLKEYSLFLKDSPEVVQISKPGLFPDLKLGLALTPQGPTYSFNFNTFSTPEAAQSWRRAILDLARSPLVASPQAIQGALRLSALHSGFPARVKTTGDRRTLAWLTPSINAPEMQRFEVELGPPGQHEFSLRFIKFAAQIQYGKPSSSANTSTPWDGLPVVQKNDIDLAIIMRAISLATALFNPDENPTEGSRETNAPVKPAAQPMALSVPQPMTQTVPQPTTRQANQATGNVKPLPGKQPATVIAQPMLTAPR